MSENGKLEHRVFTNEVSGIFENLDSRTSYMRSWAEDAEQSFRLADQLRRDHLSDSLMKPQRASEREAERHATVESLERAGVRDAVALFATVVRFTDPGVFAEQAVKVLTDAEITSLKLALDTVEMERSGRIRELQVPQSDLVGVDL